MYFSDILLIIISSAGLLHGIVFAVYLFFFKKKKTLPNFLLALILIFMAFRIGKSVMLNFGEDLEPLFIFAGLAFLLLIGPLLRWYVIGMTNATFRLPRLFFLELIPFVLLFVSSLFITKNWFESNNKQVIVIFGSVLIFIYLHFAFYIFSSSIIFRNTRSRYDGITITKSQKAVFNWLRLLLWGFVIIWVSYVLNIVEDTVPYIIGPIIYSVVVYFLCYKAFHLKVTDIDGNVFGENNDLETFNNLCQLLKDDKLYLESTVSLSSLSKLIGSSPQRTSTIINQYANQNFNDFVNYHRIEEAKKMLLHADGHKFTISSIAFDMGFSSLSSFNAAFKKFEAKTPSAFRLEHSKIGS